MCNNNNNKTAGMEKADTAKLVGKKAKVKGGRAVGWDYKEWRADLSTQPRAADVLHDFDVLPVRKRELEQVLCT